MTLFRGLFLSRMFYFVMYLILSTHTAKLEYSQHNYCVFTPFKSHLLGFRKESHTVVSTLAPLEKNADGDFFYLIHISQRELFFTYCHSVLVVCVHF